MAGCGLPHRARRISDDGRVDVDCVASGGDRVDRLCIVADSGSRVLSQSSSLAPSSARMSLDSNSAVVAAPLQYETWHEIKVKADPDSWSAEQQRAGGQSDCGDPTGAHHLSLALLPRRLPPYPLHNTNFYFKFVHDSASASFCLIVTDLCFVWSVPRASNQRSLRSELLLTRCSAFSAVQAHSRGIEEHRCGDESEWIIASR